MPCRKRRWVPAGLLVMLILAGCAGTHRAYLNDQADLEFYSRVAVVPFWTTAGDRDAGVRLADLFTTELMITGKYEVVEPGRFRNLLAEKQVSLDPQRRGLPRDKVKEVGEAAGAQALFEGTVLSYEMARVGQSSFPLITVELRMVDVESGELIWMTTLTRKGGPTVPFFGWGEIHTLDELAQKVAQDLARSVP